MGPPRTGVFWDSWLDAHYADRVIVSVKVERVVSWPDLRRAGAPVVAGKPVSAGDPDSQAPPEKGVAPRLDVARTARRLRGLPHVLLAYPGVDGFPQIVPVTVGADNQSGIALGGSLAAGGRRAGLLAHRYVPKLIGLEVRQHTGWLQDGAYAPHTEKGFRAPANKTLLLLANGVMAKRGLKHARALGRA